MAIEKNVRWGRNLSDPLGVVLLASGALIALDRGVTGPTDRQRKQH